MHVQIVTQRFVKVKVMLTSLICYITNVGGNIQCIHIYDVEIYKGAGATLFHRL